MSKKAVTIVSGFLGSGKTTLLNQIIKKYQNKRFAIIENEVGELSIDGSLIIENTGTIYEINNGCICCSLQSGFNDTILELLGQGDLFDHILIETTGIANPDSLIAGLMGDERIRSKIQLDALIIVADAMNLEDLLISTSETRKQLALADIVLLNKSSEVREDYLSALQSVIHTINPGTKIFKTDYCSIESIELLDRFFYNSDMIEKKLKEMSSVPSPKLSMLSSKLMVGIQSHDLSAVTMALPGSFHIDAFNYWIDNFLFFNEKNIYRIKGILSFYEYNERIIFQSVMNQYSMEQGSFWGIENRFCKLVFIGKGLKRENLEEGLRSLQ